MRGRASQAATGPARPRRAAASAVRLLGRAWTAGRGATLAAIAAALVTASFTGEAFAQAVPASITKSFNPSTVELGGLSIMTVTVTNPNATPLTNVQFSDTTPPGVDLITQTGGTCSTLATGGGMF